MHHASDGEAADHVDDQSAVGEGAPETLRGPERDQIARAGAGSPAETDPEKTFHVAIPLGAAA